MPTYTAEVRKSIGAYSWANTWHFFASGRGTADQVGLAIAQFERALLVTTARVDDVKVSTWPNPSGIDFTIQVLELAGQRASPNPQPADMCLLLTISAQLGRPGRKWLRMSLDESDTTQNSGTAVLVPGAGWQATFEAARNALETELEFSEAILLVGGDWLTARNSVNLISAVGVGFRDKDVGWYNRPTGP
jgi:hypothetical protein